jgi:hypothetical protein
MHCRIGPRLSQAPPMGLAPEAGLRVVSPALGHLRQCIQGRTPRTPVPAPPGLLCQGHLRLLGAAPLGTRVGGARAQR